MKQLLWQVYCYSCHCEKHLGHDVYVGKAKFGSQERHKGHIRSAFAFKRGKKSKYLQIDLHIAKVGLNKIQIRTLESLSSFDEMNSAETRLIQACGTIFTNGGLNFDLGGKGGHRLKGHYKPTQEAILAVKVALLAYYAENPLTDDQKNHLSEQNIKWSKENPEKSLERNRKVVESRTQNGTWIENLRKSSAMISTEEYQRRAAKAWQTRKRKKFRKQALRWFKNKFLGLLQGPKPTYNRC